MKYNIAMAIIVLISTICACNLNNETGCIFVGCMIAAACVMYTKVKEFKESNKEE